MTGGGLRSQPGAARKAQPAPRPPVDLRLAGPALGAWLTVWWCLGHGPGAALGCALAAALVAALALALGVAGRIVVATWVAAVALGAGAGALAVWPRLVERDTGALARQVERAGTVEVSLVVRDDPRLANGARAGLQLWVVSATAEEIEADGESQRAPGRLLVLAQHTGWRGLLPGQRVRAAGRLLAPEGRDLTAAVLRTTAAPQRVGSAPWWQRAAGSLRAGLQDACRGLPPQPGGLLPGLVVGDTSRLDAGVTAAFKQTGLTHLTAVSGANLAIMAGLVLAALGWARAGPWTSATLAGLAIAGFVVLARPSPSVLRAAAMCGLGLLALALGRPRAAVPALCASVLALVMVDPALAAAPGFALSAAATAGLLLIAPGWAAALHRRGLPRLAADALAVPAAAQAACAPLLAAVTGTVSLTAIPANLAAAPAVGPATVLGLLAAVTSPVAPPLAAGFAWLGQWPARWLILVAEHGAAVPDGLIPWPAGAAGGWLLAAVLAAGAFGSRWRLPRRLIAAVSTALVVAVLPIRVAAPGWPPPGWVLVGCDVGQGDALALRAGPGAAVVVDAGPDLGPVDECLRRLGIETVPLLVLSHFHLDHIGGVDGVLDGRTVGAIGFGQFEEPPEGAAAVRASASRAGVPLVRLAVGEQLALGEVTLQVLGPAQLLHGTRSDPNNNSVILKATVRSVSILLPGDAEHDAERALMSAGTPLAVDVLKVPHHGSAWSDPEFLDATAARVAVIEVGVDNDYGHPSPVVITHLTRLGAKVLRTDLDGDVAVVAGPVRDGRAAIATVVRGRDRVP